MNNTICERDNMADVAIVYGSTSDDKVMQGACDILDEFGITYEREVRSAHRQPDATAKFAQGAEGRGVKVIIAGAGLAAALPGVVAAHTTLPVIGVPIGGGPLNGGRCPLCHRADAERYPGCHLSAYPMPKMPRFWRFRSLHSRICRSRKS